MNNKIIISIFSFILCVVLFFVEILYLMLFSVRSGIKKDNIVNIINDIPVVSILENFNEYESLKLLNTDLVFDIVSSDEMNTYIKENLKATFFNNFFHDDVSYVSSSDLLSFSIERCLDYNDISVLDSVNRLIAEYDHFIQDDDSILVVSSILSSATLNILLVIGIVLILFVVLINRSYKSLLWLGIPTLFSGFLFFLLTLSFGGTVNIVSFDTRFLYYISRYFSHLIIKMRFLSMMFFALGCVLCSAYYFVKKGLGVNDGK